MMYKLMDAQCIKHIVVGMLNCGLLLQLVGCGTPNESSVNQRSIRNIVSAPDVSGQSPEETERLQASLSRFNRDCQQTINQVNTIAIMDLDGTTLGRCYFGGDRANYIRIDVAVLQYSDTILDAVMYHELGHCQLGLPHSSDQDQMMYPTLNTWDEQGIRDTWETRVKSLGQQCEVRK